jgi:hypothetical protein
MAGTFELWEMSTGNLMGAYESEARALAVMTSAIRSYGPSYADTIALIHEDARGGARVLAEGAALAERVQRASEGDSRSDVEPPQPAPTELPA